MAWGPDPRKERRHQETKLTKARKPKNTTTKETQHYQTKTIPKTLCAKTSWVSVPASLCGPCCPCCIHGIFSKKPEGTSERCWLSKVKLYPGTGSRVLLPTSGSASRCQQHKLSEEEHANDCHHGTEPCSSHIQ